MNIFLILILDFFLSITRAHAWGHHVLLSKDPQAFLIQHALEEKMISYCIEINDSNFDRQSIESQTLMALQLWLKPISKIGTFQTKFQSVDCSSEKLNLKIRVGPDDSYKHAFFRVKRDHKNFYSEVVLNTTNEDINPYFIYDSIQMLTPNESLNYLLNYISIDHPLTTQELADFLGWKERTVSFSSYRILLHEIGHTMGLCDLYPGGISKFCDSKNMSPGIDQAQPVSLMNDPKFFYLAKDDIDGIISLVQRFLKK
jgi:hypothetical protein